ncbi:unnamed protein product, partial [Adineta steineri]
MDQAWILSNTARFRIKTIEFISNKIKEDDKSSLEMPPPPSPASSTCSVDSNTSFVSTLKRKKHTTGANLFLPTSHDNESNEQSQQQQQLSKIKDEEYWPLDEVIFIEDYKVAPVGKVMKIDGSLVLVKFPSKNNDTDNDTNNLDNCRILRKDDLQIVKGNQIPKTPDCTLSLINAKRISLENGTLLTYSVDKDYKTQQKYRINSQQILTVGCSVCLISNPYYNQGAWAFYIRDGQPKLGQLMDQAWILSNTARFRIKTIEFISNKMKEDDKSSLEMPPPPSPASSTCSVDSNTSFVSTLKRKKHTTGANLFLPTTHDNESNEQSQQQQQLSKIKDEEYWPLDEVIFIEDYKVAPVGKVMKIDGSLVLVKFPSKNNDTDNDTNNLDNCRILRKDDLQIVKGNQIPKTPDCTLSLINAKRISLENGTLLTYSVDKDYLHTLQLCD